MGFRGKYFGSASVQDHFETLHSPRLCLFQTQSVILYLESKRSGGRNAKAAASKMFYRLSGSLGTSHSAQT